MNSDVQQDLHQQAQRLVSEIFADAQQVRALLPGSLVQYFDNMLTTLMARAVEQVKAALVRRQARSLESSPLPTWEDYATNPNVTMWLGLAGGLLDPPRSLSELIGTRIVYLDKHGHILDGSPEVPPIVKESTLGKEKHIVPLPYLRLKFDDGTTQVVDWRYNDDGKYPVRRELLRPQKLPPTLDGQNIGKIWDGIALGVQVVRDQLAQRPRLPEAIVHLEVEKRESRRALNVHRELLLSWIQAADPRMFIAQKQFTDINMHTWRLCALFCGQPPLFPDELSVLQQRSQLSGLKAGDVVSGYSLTDAIYAPYRKRRWNETTPVEIRYLLFQLSSAPAQAVQGRVSHIHEAEEHLTITTDDGREVLIPTLYTRIVKLQTQQEELPTTSIFFFELYRMLFGSRDRKVMAYALRSILSGLSGLKGLTLKAQRYPYGAYQVNMTGKQDDLLMERISLYLYPVDRLMSEIVLTDDHGRPSDLMRDDFGSPSGTLVRVEWIPFFITKLIENQGQDALTRQGLGWLQTLKTMNPVLVRWPDLLPKPRSENVLSDYFPLYTILQEVCLDGNKVLFYINQPDDTHIDLLHSCLRLYVNQLSPETSVTGTNDIRFANQRLSPADLSQILSTSFVNLRGDDGLEGMLLWGSGLPIGLSTASAVSAFAAVCAADCIQRNVKLSPYGEYHLQRQHILNKLPVSQVSASVVSKSVPENVPSSSPDGCTPMVYQSPQYGHVKVTCNKPSKAGKSYHNIQTDAQFYGYEVDTQRWAMKRIPPNPLLEELEQRGLSFWNRR